MMTLFEIMVVVGVILAAPSAEGKPSSSWQNFPVSSPFVGGSDSDIDLAKLDVISNGTIDQVSKFQAFISYRRAASRNLAMLLKVLLDRENVTSFLDVEDLEGGVWDEQLIKGIDESPNFILVLSNGTLDRALGDDNYTDFLHKEIKEAVDTERRIVLVFDDYDFPSASQFSPEIQAALENQGLTWQHALVDQSLERLMSYMRHPVPLSSSRFKQLTK